MENYPGKLFASCMLTGDADKASPKYQGDNILSVSAIFDPNVGNYLYLVTLASLVDTSQTSLACVNVESDPAFAAAPRIWWVKSPPNPPCTLAVQLDALGGRGVQIPGRWSLQVYRTSFVPSDGASP